MTKRGKEHVALLNPQSENSEDPKRSFQQLDQRVQLVCVDTYREHRNTQKKQKRT